MGEWVWWAGRLVSWLVGVLVGYIGWLVDWMPVVG